MKKKTFKQLVNENRSHILKDKDAIEKVHKKIEDRQLADHNSRKNP
ncbi:FbpB family small basic protein [Sutcliffiella horikoshii]|uniref:FbpB family small basic protein n=1 Tax=Sutcliffiella horikoshii TaxID=79883 RepID=A0A5D4S770_9BACI|nr:FbpB family small basic protein [Sutcliffiella horikoshii]TYS59533.1 FbpB family small basic protein [Sutcliffiella horikoshii]